MAISLIFMQDQSLGLSVEWVEYATPEAKADAQQFLSDFALLFEQCEIPAVIDRITMKRLHP
mgnify:CR=1 FL=1